jgi:hypothetical protein
MRESFETSHLPAPPVSRGSGPAANGMAWAHAAYRWGAASGPIVSLRSFEAATGPKVDGWLVKKVGALLAAAGAAIGSAATNRRVTPEIALLGAGCAATLAAIDIVYVAKRRIPPVYLLDAAAEVALVAGWIASHGDTEARR